MSRDMHRVMSQPVENVTDLLSCAVCMEPFDDHESQPKLLPCHHTFCKACLHNMVSSNCQVQCPTCREKFTLSSPPSEGVARLQTNFYVTQMREIIQHGAQTKHKVCKKHGHKPLSFFCSTCEVTICAECSNTDHTEELGHVTEDLHLAETRQKQVLQVEVASAQQSVLTNQAHSHGYEIELGSLFAAKNQARLDVDAAFDRCVDLVNQRRQEMRKLLQDTYDQTRDDLRLHCEAYKKQSTCLTGLIEQCSDAMNAGTILDMMAYKVKLTSKNREIIREEQEPVFMGNNYLKFSLGESEANFMDVVQDIGDIALDNPLPNNITVRTGDAVESLFTNLTVSVKSYHGTELENMPISVNVEDMYGDKIACMVQHRSTGLYEVLFRPEVCGQHRVQVKFLDHMMTGCNVSVDVKSNDPVQVIGNSGDDTDDMDFPRAVAVDSSNHIYVMDTGNNRIQIFNKNGRRLQQFPINSDDDNTSSCGMALNEKQGTIVCPEVKLQEANLSGAHTLLIYSMHGELVSRLVFRDVMKKALSVGVNSQGHMIIADFELNTIFLFDRHGRLYKKFGETGKGNGQFNHPTFVCIGESDNIIVADGENHRIQVFDKASKFLYQFGHYGIGKGQFDMPFGVTADCHGNILVVDGGNKRIQIFKAGGGFLSCIESVGDPLSAPRGIAVTSDGYVLVADRDNHCIKKYKYLHCTSI